MSDPSPFRIATWFFVRALLAFIILAIPLWVVLDPVYRTVFRAETRALAAIIERALPSLTGEIEALAPELVSVGRDHTVTIFNHQTKRFTQAKVSSYFIGFFPLVIVIALVAATPLSNSRRWRSLLLGVIGINVFIALRIVALFSLLYAGTRHPNLEAFWKDTGQSVSTVVYDLPSVSFCASIIVWILVVAPGGFPLWPKNAVQ